MLKALWSDKIAKTLKLSLILLMQAFYKHKVAFQNQSSTSENWNKWKN